MADAHRSFKIRRYPRSAGDWTPIIVPPGGFSRVVIENTDSVNAAQFRTDVDNGLTEKSIPAGLELDVRAVEATFEGGDIVGYFNVSSASAAVASFTR